MVSVSDESPSLIPVFLFLEILLVVCIASEFSPIYTDTYNIPIVTACYFKKYEFFFQSIST